MGRPDTKTHSIINEPSKLLISKYFQVALSIFAVKVSGTSIGAGFGAIP